VLILALAISILTAGIPTYAADVLFEQFEAGIPDTWTVVDNSGGGCGIWQTSNPGGRGNLTGGSGGFAIVDSDLEGCADTVLISPSFGIPLNAHLTFNTDYFHLADVAKVDITSDGGGAWANLLHWEEDHRGPLKVDIDLSAYLDETVQIRFVNIAAQDRWWEVDNIRLEFPDVDGDGIEDSVDNCPNDVNEDQADENGDGFGDVCNSSAVVVGCADCTISNVTSPGLPSGAPSGFRVTDTVSFTATEVNNTADISITYSSLPTNPYFYKVANERWMQIYPINNSSGIRKVSLKGNRLSYTITDNSNADEDPTLGTIEDPVAAGYSSSGITVSGDCFIATAVYGSPMAPQVQLLRKFRDLFLLPNPAGKAFVDLYYDYSPPVADFITKHTNIRQLVRWGLLPFVGMSWIVLTIGPLYFLIAMLLLCICFIGFAKLVHRRWGLKA
jgi:hypothetical protein